MPSIKCCQPDLPTVSISNDRCVTAQIKVVDTAHSVEVHKSNLFEWPSSLLAIIYPARLASGNLKLALLLRCALHSGGEELKHNQ